MDGVRTIQRFLTTEGVFTVTATEKRPKEFFCDCQRRKCPHIEWVLKNMKQGLYPLLLTEDVTEDAIADALMGNDVEYEEFLLRYGKVVTM